MVRPGNEVSENQDTMPKVTGKSAYEGEDQLAITQWIDNITNEYEVVVFGKTTCPHTSNVKELLKQKEFTPVSIMVYDLDEMVNGEAMKQCLTDMTQQATVPYVYVNGSFLGGSDATKEAYDSGKLQQMILKVQ